MAKTVGLTFEPEKPKKSKREVIERLEAEGVEFDPKLPVFELRKLLTEK